MKKQTLLNALNDVDDKVVKFYKLKRGEGWVQVAMRLDDLNIAYGYHDLLGNVIGAIDSDHLLDINGAKRFHIRQVADFLRVTLVRLERELGVAASEAAIKILSKEQYRTLGSIIAVKNIETFITVGIFKKSASDPFDQFVRFWS